jgi:aspartate racemase
MEKRISAKNELEVPAMKKIGIIGGMGQWATIDIVNRILKASVDYPVPQYGNRGYPRMDILMINKRPMNLNPDGTYPDELTPSPTLLEAAEHVGKDADFIILGSNTSHIFVKEITAAAVGKPILSLVDLAIQEAVKRQCKRVGIMAIGVTIKEKLFQKPLAEQGIESVLLPEELGERLEKESIYPLQEGTGAKNLSKAALDALNYLRNKKVDATILGCTEIPVVLGEHADDKDIINPSQLVAEAAIKKALSV